MQVPYYLADTLPLFRFKDAFSYLPSSPPHVYIAFSGGLDSHILLHATLTTFPHAQLTAIHINHGWHQDAKQWEKHCQMICDQFNVPLVIHDISPLLKSKAYIKGCHGPEEAARKARYNVLKGCIQKGDCLLTGHHLEDQAETLLLQLSRGAGIQGLASMPLFNECEKGYHLRPLLTWSKQERLEYAKHNQLKWIEDSSNFDQRFRRNFIRHQVLPLLKQQWPTISTVLARTAAHCAQANALSIECAIQDLKPCRVNYNALSIKALLKLSPLRQRNALRYWLQAHFNKPLSTTQFTTIEKLIYSNNAVAQFNLKELVIKRYQGYLYVIKPHAFSEIPSTPMHWDWRTPLDIPYFGKLIATLTPGQGIRLPADTFNLTIRFRQGGERFQPKGRFGSHPVKKLYQEWHIPPWERPYIPLLYLDTELLAIPGYAISAHHTIAPNELGLSIEVIRANSIALN